METKIKFSVKGQVGVICLTDPPLNLFDTILIEQLADAIAQAGEADIRALMITAAGPHFSGGADVAMFKDRSVAQAREMFEAYIPIIHALEALPVPTLAVVQGLCLAAGLELALGCDLIWAGQSARFSQVEALIGTTTLLGGAQRLAARVGTARAREIVYTADVYDARTFETWHIINKVVPDEELASLAFVFAEKLAKGPTRALAASKQLVREVSLSGVHAADRLILDVGAALFETEDMQRGVDRLLKNGARNVRKDVVFDGR